MSGMSDCSKCGAEIDEMEGVCPGCFGQVTTGGIVRPSPRFAFAEPTAAQAAIIDHLNEAETKAWDSLASYKFQMFGYWAAIWVHLNRIGEFKRPNPFKELIKIARANNYCQPIAHQPKPSPAQPKEGSDR